MSLTERFRRISSNLPEQVPANKNFLKGEIINNKFRFDPVEINTAEESSNRCVNHIRITKYVKYTNLFSLDLQICFTAQMKKRPLQSSIHFGLFLQVVWPKKLTSCPSNLLTLKQCCWVSHFRAFSTRLIVASWWLFVLIMISSYIANLVTFTNFDRPLTEREKIHSV